jgi:tetratricopeptide (TPR) repeat protein
MRIANRSNFIAAALILLAFGATAAAQEQASPAILFFSTAPINASVLRDGTPLVGQTPLLLRDLAPGRHRFEVRKEGYPTRSVEVELAPGELKSVVVDLAAGLFQVALPNEMDLRVAGQQELSAGTLFQLPEGDYRVRREGQILEFQPRYRLQGVIVGLNISLPLAAAFCGVLTLYDLLNPPASGFAVSAATLSAYGITAGLVSFDIVLRLKRQTFYRDYSYSTRPLSESPHVALELFDRAEALLAMDRREEALHFYGLVVHEHPDSVYLPQALFKTAKIHFLTGDDTLAMLEFQLLADRYPLAELYDKAQKALADLYAQRGGFAESLAHLDAMVFADPLYSREEIDLYRCEILGQWAEQDPSRRPELLEAWRSLVERYPSSPSSAEYRKRLEELEGKTP